MLILCELHHVLEASLSLCNIVCVTQKLFLVADAQLKNEWKAFIHMVATWYSSLYCKYLVLSTDQEHW